MVFFVHSYYLPTFYLLFCLQAALGVQEWGPQQAAAILADGQYTVTAESVAAVRLMTLEWLHGVALGEWGKGNGAAGKRGRDNDDATRKLVYYQTVRLVKKQRDEFVEQHGKGSLLLNIIDSGISSDPYNELTGGAEPDEAPDAGTNSFAASEQLDLELLAM